MLQIYNIVSLFGNITSGIYFPDAIGAGASTALYGYFGAVWGATIFQRHGMRSEINFVVFWVTGVYGVFSLAE